MRPFTPRLRFAAALTAVGLLVAAAGVEVIDHSPGLATVAAAASGLVTVALAVVVRD